MRLTDESMNFNRRRALKAAALALAAPSLSRAEGLVKAIRVVVWDERQPQQKQAYENFLGGAIADHLRKSADFEVKSVKLDDPDQGLSDETLNACDVLIWWGHVRHREVHADKVKSIVDRIERGTLSLIALHSAHWSSPFIQAMRRRAIADALAEVPEKDRAKAKLVLHEAKLYMAPKRTDPLSPSTKIKTEADGTVVVEVELPNCCFPAYRADGKPSHVRVLMPDHPIAKGIPERFDIPATEMYDAPFHVPEPNAVIFKETWDLGEKFPAGCLWTLGEGRVFYFRPGHETYPVFKQREPLQIVENAARWMGSPRK